ncbi:hypothetical protein VP1G_10687 [Cytospora mali]|uniref:Uncharacterized protein n=1 Tax=Cytospora mali TaxID=578113 RepID=A0A194URW3_CYTMA|nr:hypothetical protein VP1G_10687 [Valsa mali var. pyri (nom. inval.)]
MELTIKVARSTGLTLFVACRGLSWPYPRTTGAVRYLGYVAGMEYLGANSSTLKQHLVHCGP